MNLTIILIAVGILFFTSNIYKSFKSDSIFVLSYLGAFFAGLSLLHGFLELTRVETLESYTKPQIGNLVISGVCIITLYLIRCGSSVR